VEGVVVEKAFDAVGLLNYQTTVVPIPQWKGDAFAEWNMGPHNLRLTVTISAATPTSAPRRSRPTPTRTPPARA
jgi:hypothetical protein